jgi:hypothetical protein
VRSGGRGWSWRSAALGRRRHWGDGVLLPMTSGSGHQCACLGAHCLRIPNAVLFDELVRLRRSRSSSPRVFFQRPCHWSIFNRSPASGETSGPGQGAALAKPINAQQAAASGCCFFHTKHCPSISSSLTLLVSIFKPGQKGALLLFQLCQRCRNLLFAGCRKPLFAGQGYVSARPEAQGVVAVINCSGAEAGGA